MSSIVSDISELASQLGDAELVAAVASFLDDGDIPYVLWDKWLLRLYGVPTIVDGLAFVVADDMLQHAYEMLYRANFAPCTLGDSCLQSPKCHPRFTPAPNAHLHITDSCCVMLFNQSELLGHLPNLSATPRTNAAKPDFILASDLKRLPGPNELGSGGRISPDLHPVRALSVWRFVEACMLLLQRSRRYGGYWVSHLCYIALYVDKNKDVFDENDLEPVHKAAFGVIRSGKGRLRDVLGAPQSEI